MNLLIFPHLLGVLLLQPKLEDVRARLIVTITELNRWHQLCFAVVPLRIRLISMKYSPWMMSY